MFFYYYLFAGKFIFSSWKKFVEFFWVIGKNMYRKLSLFNLDILLMLNYVLFFILWKFIKVFNKWHDNKIIRKWTFVVEWIRIPTNGLLKGLWTKWQSIVSILTKNSLFYRSAWRLRPNILNTRKKGRPFWFMLTELLFCKAKGIKILQQQVIYFLLELNVAIFLK